MSVCLFLSFLTMTTNICADIQFKDTATVQKTAGLCVRWHLCDGVGHVASWNADRWWCEHFQVKKVASKNLSHTKLYSSMSIRDVCRRWEVTWARISGRLGDLASSKKSVFTPRCVCFFGHLEVASPIIRKLDICGSSSVCSSCQVCHIWFPYYFRTIYKFMLTCSYDIMINSFLTWLCLTGINRTMGRTL